MFRDRNAVPYDKAITPLFGRLGFPCVDEDQGRTWNSYTPVIAYGEYDEIVPKLRKAVADREEDGDYDVFFSIRDALGRLVYHPAPGTRDEIPF